MHTAAGIHAQGYRADIDGLRALAVLPVVLFHAGLFGVTGGYVGVDVFFVISGYLITGIILREHETGEFSLVRFYERRVRRILPALFAVIATTSVAAFIIFMPRELQQFGHSAIATVLFVSNMYFYDTTDYFATALDQKPLLHTWSLAVEEQFYIFHPVLLPLVIKYARAGPVAVTAVIAVLSFVLSHILVLKDPAGAFYLAPARVWELLAGALLALRAVPPITNRMASDAIGLAGLAAIFASVLLYTPETPFPGAAALLPVLGTAAVIHAGELRGSLVARVLSWPPLVGLGLISYSLYLWHWPLITFSEYYLLRPLLTHEALAIVAISLVLAYLSWRFIEMPFRRPAGVLSRRPLFIAAASAGAVFVALGIAVAVGRGLPNRLPQDISDLTRLRDVGKKTMAHCQRDRSGELSPPNSCIIGVKSGSPSFVLWGDSHAVAFGPIVDRIADKYGLTGVASSKATCAPVLGLKLYGKWASKRCALYNEDVYNFIIENKIKRVVMVARWALYAQGTRYKFEAGEPLPLSTAGIEENAAVLGRLMEVTIRALQLQGVEVLIVGPVPEVGVDVPSVLARAAVWGRELPDLVPKREFTARQREVLDLLASVGQQKNVEVVYPHEKLCDDQRCRVEQDGRPFYWDDDHLSQAGGSLVGELIEGTFSRWATEGR